VKVKEARKKREGRGEEIGEREGERGEKGHQKVSAKNDTEVWDIQKILGYSL
jgi:hypothetical protein